MYSAISKNKRNTVLIMAVFVALIGVIGIVVGYLNDNYSLSVYYFSYGCYLCFDSVFCG